MKAHEVVFLRERLKRIAHLVFLTPVYCGAKVSALDLLDQTLKGLRKIRPCKKPRQYKPTPFGKKMLKDLNKAFGPGEKRFGS
jgi:hypothetical protein